MIGYIIAAMALLAPCDSTTDSIEATAQALSACYYRISRQTDTEYMATILEENGIYEARVVRGKRKQHSVTITILRRKTQKLVALWHTHGSVHMTRNYFSPTDTRLANRIGVPFYLTDPVGRLHVFKPGAPTWERKMLRGSRVPLPPGTAPGEIITPSLQFM